MDPGLGARGEEYDPNTLYRIFKELIKYCNCFNAEVYSKNKEKDKKHKNLNKMSPKLFDLCNK